MPRENINRKMHTEIKAVIKLTDKDCTQTYTHECT